jgi:hypothetical protein
MTFDWSSVVFTYEGVPYSGALKAFPRIRLSAYLSYTIMHSIWLILAQRIVDENSEDLLCLSTMGKIEDRFTPHIENIVQFLDSSKYCTCLAK